MVSEVDQKYLGIFAKQTALNDPELSAALYKVLGLSTLLNRKLVRARKQRKLDPTRPTKSLDLYKHINWMGREGYNIVETIIPHVNHFIELRVLVYKLKASFLHVFVLFEFTPHTKINVLSSIHQQHQQQQQQHQLQSSSDPTLILTTPTSPILTSTPGGIKELNYIRPAQDAFQRAYDLASQLLPGIHPLRLSVIVEYSAFMFDCVKDHEESRRLAKRGVEDALEVVDAIEDDESFDEARDLVGSLAIMAKRVSPPLTTVTAGGLGLDGHAYGILTGTPPTRIDQAASHGDLKNKGQRKVVYDLEGNPLRGK